MQNLKILNVEVKSSTSIVIEFSHILSLGIKAENILIEAKNNLVPSSEVLQIKQKDNFVFINCQPLTPFYNYIVKAKKTLLYNFVSQNGIAYLFEDGVSNIYEIFGPIEKENLFKNIISDSLKDGVYNIENQSTMPSTIINSISKFLDKALEDIKQVKNENYVSFDVIDEIKIRGTGPFDKLNEGSAYEVIKVSNRPSNSNLEQNLTIDSSERTLISLQESSFSEVIYSNNIDKSGYFNITNFIISLSKENITKINSITFTLTTTNPIFEYNIEKYGYQILESKYDSRYASNLLTLESNQIKLNEQILNDTLFDISQILKIDVVYLYKDTSKIINSNIDVFQIKKTVREVLPPIINNFFLKNSPIVNSSGLTGNLGDVIFINLNSKNQIHNAFLNEINFRYEELPFLPGQYSIDYNTGNVFVFGDNLSKTGTGAEPPVATYFYKFSLENEIDYVYDSETYELSFLPKGKAIDTSVNVIFKYEVVYVNGFDYNASLHEESLNERIENKLNALNCLRVKNYPITNVFRIYNETSGEVYTLSRFDEDKIYFKYLNPPNIQNSLEIVNFNQYSELLQPKLFLTNASLIKIVAFELSNKGIVGATNDGIGYYLNTSVSFTNNLFVKELFFNKELTEEQNLNSLNQGYYIIDYTNSIIYLAVNNYDNDYGSVSYKSKNILPNFPHVIYGNNCFYKKIAEDNINLEIESVDEKSILLKTIEDNLEYKSTSNYILYNNEIGYFADSVFNNKVKYTINSINGIYEYNDLINSTNPINFATGSSFSEKTVQVSNYTKTINTDVKYSVGDGYYLEIEKEIYYVSPNINYDFTGSYLNGTSITINSFSIEENTNKIFINETNLGLVELILNFSINNYSGVAIDYNKGNLFVDYNYLADEILVSYEYGLNALDFRKSKTISPGTQYYVSYKVGALRDALIRNFGNLVNISELSNLDTYFDRERYRDALYAALSSFIQGATIPSIKNIVKQIVHTEPEIKESLFNFWSLGNSLLYPEKVKTNCNTFLPAKHGDGILVSNGNYISLPTANNINIEEGTLEFWSIPQWNGLDNISDVNFEILNPSLPMDTNKIFIGANEYHPSSNKFSVNKSSVIKGKPNLNKDGVFIYLDKDAYDIEKWHLFILDGYESASEGYNFKINSEEFYNFKFVDGYQESTITSTNKKINISSDAYSINELYTFIADNDKYFIDMKEDNSRFSIYKDKSGYLNFLVKDKNNKTAKISHNVSDWVEGESKHIAVSWKLNSKILRDELHLFINGQEVSNTLNYSSNIEKYNNQKFKTIAKESFIGSVDKDIVSSTDLITIAGSPIVESLINFNSYNILVGDTIVIDNSSFSFSGYTIVAINGQELTLDQNMPVSLDDLTFYINKTNINVNGRYYLNTNNYLYKLSSKEDGYANLTLNTNIININTSNIELGDLIKFNEIYFNNYYTIVGLGSNYVELNEYLPITGSSVYYNIYSNSPIELKSPRTQSPDYSLNNGYLTLLNNVNKYDLLFIESLGLNHELTKAKYYEWSDSLTNIIKTQLPKPISLDDIDIYKILLNNKIINQSNCTLIGFDFTSDQILTDQPINSQSGRQLSLNISGSNIDFSSSVIVEINGIVNYITTSEYLNFTDFNTLYTSNEYTNINYIKVYGKCLNTNKNFLSLIIKERESIFNPEVSYYTPVLNYSYLINSGISLQKLNDNTVVDYSNVFSNKNVNDYLIISEPITVAGFYKITQVSDDLQKLTIEPIAGYSLPLPDFTDGYYQILNSTNSSTGIQNGFFNFEPLDYPGQPYFLRKGFYEFNYPSFLRLEFDLPKTIFIGSDFDKKNQSNSIINEFVVYNVMLSDIRAGESSNSINSITKDFNSLKGIEPNKNITCLFKFNDLNNSALYYKYNKEKNINYANYSVNEEFNNSLYLKNKSLFVENKGYLDSKKEGTIEFWISPIYDTLHDYSNRYYFDSSSLFVEEVTSTKNNIIEIAGNAEKIISVKIESNNVNYFDGGFLDYKKNNAKSEYITSVNTNKIILSEEIGSIISVKIVNDYAYIDYFGNGSIANDSKTIYLEKSLPSNNTNVIVTYNPKNVNSNTKQIIVLGKQLPSHNTKVKVTYVQKGLGENRISIFKDKDSFINFEVQSEENIWSIRAPVVWDKFSWHRIKASYKFNSSSDDMSLFIDGYKYSSLTYNNSIYGESPYLYGSSFIGDGYFDGYTKQLSISFSNNLNYFTIGSDYTGYNFGNCMIDNLRISNKYRNPIKYLNEYIDVSYNGSSSLPVVSDLYTTYLLDSDITLSLFEDFSQIINKNNGAFDFTLNIFDSFKILDNNAKSKDILERLLNILKPANSRIFLNYI